MDTTKKRSSRSLGSKRIQLELPMRTIQRLNNLKDATEASSYVEVIRHSLRLYEAIVKEAQQGREFYIKESGGAVVPYKMFI